MVRPRDDADVLAQVLHQFELVAREDHGHAGVDLLHDDALQVGDHDRVEAGEGLVEDEQPRCVHESDRELDALSVSGRQRLHQLVAAIPEADPLDPYVSGSLCVGSPEAGEATEVGDLLVDAHAGIEAPLLREIADGPTCLVTTG